MKTISIVSRSGLAALAMFAVAPAQAAWTLNMDAGVTDLTSDVFNLHMLIFWICVVIGIGVFGAMLISVIFHRKSRGYEAAHFHESTVVEIAWTVVPFLILIAVAIPAAGTLLQVEDSSNPDMTIRVTGHQWLWEYDYVDQGVHFYSRLDRKRDRARQPNSGIDPADVPHYLRNVDKPMVVPVHQKVRLLLTSGDVIHSWWVPALSGKKDAIPGYINDMWFKANKTGTYRGQCAELCGRGHAFMPIVVKVVSQGDYKQWVAKQGGNKNGNSALATGQPSTDAADAQAQTAADSSPTAGDATAGRAEDSNTENTAAAKDSAVGVGQQNNGGGSAQQQQDNNAKQAAPDRGSPKVPDPGQPGGGESQGASGGGAGPNAGGQSRSTQPSGNGSGSESAGGDAGAASGGGAGQNGGGQNGAGQNGSAQQSGTGGGSAQSGGDAGGATGGGQMAKADLMAQGKQVYGNICVACHQPKGQGMPAAGFPALAGSKIATGPIPGHIKQVLNGKGAMPPYKGALDDKQIAAVVTYERNSFGNTTGDVVQPSQVAQQR